MGKVERKDARVLMELEVQLEAMANAECQIEADSTAQSRQEPLFTNAEFTQKLQFLSLE
jgi:hypothetical protein